MQDNKNKRKRSTKRSKPKLETKQDISTLKLPEVIELPEPPIPKPVKKSIAYAGALQRKAQAKTREERAIIQKTHDLSVAEKAVRAAKLKLQKVTDKADEVLESVDELDEDMQKLKEASRKAQLLSTTSLTDSIAFKPNEGPQTDFLAASEDEVLYGGARGGGKRVALTTLTCTTKGIKTVGDLLDGDTLVNPDGSTTKVLKVHPITQETIHRMTFSNGAVIDSCKDHLWYGNIRFKKSNPLDSWEHPRCVKDTQWIYDHYQKNNTRLKKFAVPLCKPLAFEEKVLDLPPYLLGCLLGDGTIGGNLKSPTPYIKQTTHTDDLEHFTDHYKKAGYTEYNHTKIGGPERNCWDIGFRGESRVLLTNQTKALGLWGSRSATKFIPEIYKYSSVEQRFALLQGLLDTDGSVEAAKVGNDGYSRTHRIKYYTISEQLAKDFVELASGLGFHTSKRLRSARNKVEKDGTVYKCRPCYEIDIKSIDDSRAFRLKRKKELCGLPPKDWRPVTYLDSIERLDEKVAMRCITVDHPNCLYMVTGASGQGYVASHNTYALIADPLRYIENPNFKALLMRRTTVELRDIIRETRKLYPKIYPGAKYLKADKIWEFPSGAIIEMGYAETLDDAERYRGQAYTYIGIDELGQHPTSDIYDLLLQSLRTTDPTLKTYMRCTANPGGLGAAWLKERFINAAPHNTRFWKKSEYIHPITKELIQVKRSFKYIPATVFDNPYLMQDPTYVATLASLPPAQKEMMLYGNWDVVEDGSFPEFTRRTHVVKEFPIPSHWPRFTSIDWGYSTPFCVLWFACDDWGNIFVYREYYGQGVLADEFAREVLSREHSERIMYRVIDGSVASKRGEIGPSVHETLQDNGLHCGFADRSPGSRIMGKQEVHKRLALKFTGELLEDGSPKEAPTVFFFETCLNLIRTLPMMINDPLDIEKVLKKGADDHAYDALRYGLSSRPSMPQQLEQSAATNRSLEYQPADSTFGY